VDSKLPRAGTINAPLTIHFHQGLIEVCQRSVIGDDSQSHTQSHISAAKGEHQTHTSGVEVDHEDSQPHTQSHISTLSAEPSSAMTIGNRWCCGLARWPTHNSRDNLTGLMLLVAAVHYVLHAQVC
jgi:hypothetical protein